MSAELPRIEYEDIVPALKELFRPRVERLGYLGEFFRVMSAAPETMTGFFTITESLKKVLPDNFTEIVSLVCAPLFSLVICVGSSVLLFVLSQ